MSSPGGPYQSRFFNFLNRQKIRIQDGLGTTIRHLKTAAEMGVQLLLYPVYLMMQTGRFLGRQLKQQIMSGYLPSVPESEIDSSSTEAFLTTVEPSSLQENSSNQQTRIAYGEAAIAVTDGSNSWLSTTQNSQSSLVKVGAIQGIATLLECRRLVLVDQENRILDVLSPKQQQQLQRYLFKSEKKSPVAANLLTKASRKVLAGLPKISKTKSQNLPPVRLWGQVVEWLQSNPVAVGVSFLGKSHRSITPTLPSSLTSQPLPLPEFLAKVDQVIADLETKPLTFASTLVQSWRSRLSSFSQQQSPSTKITASTPNQAQVHALIRAAVAHFFGKQQKSLANSKQNIPAIEAGKSKPTALLSGVNFPDVADDKSVKAKLPVLSQVNNWLEKISSSNLGERSRNAFKSNLDAYHSMAESDPFGLQVLIQTAVDYFFGKSGTMPLKGDRRRRGEANRASHLPSANKQHSLPSASTEEPWLTWSDLFGSLAPSQTDSSNNPSSLPQAASTSLKPGKSFKAKVESSLPQQKSQSFSVASTQPNQLTQTQQQDSTLTQTANGETDLDVAQSDSSIPEAEPDWVETKAVNTGYIKHPLERILELLDRLILWLEELALKIWKQIKKLNI